MPGLSAVANPPFFSNKDEISNFIISRDVSLLYFYSLIGVCLQVYRSWGVILHMWKSDIKPRVWATKDLCRWRYCVIERKHTTCTENLIWSTASSDVTEWLSCIVGNVSSRFRKGWRTCGIKVISSVMTITDQWTASQNLAPTLPTMHFSHWVTSLETDLCKGKKETWTHHLLVSETLKNRKQTRISFKTTILFRYSIYWHVMTLASKCEVYTNS